MERGEVYGHACPTDCLTPLRQTKIPLRKSSQDWGRGKADKAERSGFEPEMPVSRHTGLAIRRFRPLSHLSGVKFVGVNLAGVSRRGLGNDRADDATIVGKLRKSKVIRASALTPECR